MRKWINSLNKCKSLFYEVKVVYWYMKLICLYVNGTRGPTKQAFFMNHDSCPVILTSCRSTSPPTSVHPKMGWSGISHRVSFSRRLSPRSSLGFTNGDFESWSAHDHYWLGSNMKLIVVRFLFVLGLPPINSFWYQDGMFRLTLVWSDTSWEISRITSHILRQLIGICIASAKIWVVLVKLFLKKVHHIELDSSQSHCRN